jgi:beta-galactosidase
VRAEGAEVLAEVDGGDLDGTPVLLRHGHGAGTGWYLATRPEPAATAAIMSRVCAEAGVGPVAPVAPGVEAVRRTGGGGSWLFLLNHHDRPVSTALPSPAVDLLTGRRLEGTITLERFGVAVLAQEGS